MMDYLRRRHAPLCRQWFEDLEPFEINSGLLRIRTSNDVQRNYLQRKCLDQFNEAAQAVTGALVAVRFVNQDAALPAVARSGESAFGAALDHEATMPATDVGVGAQAGADASGEHRPRPTSIIAAAAANMPAAPASSSPSSRPAGRAPTVLMPARSHDSDPTDIEFDQVVISPDNSFENFISGPNNQLAYAAAVAVANQPGTAYNPLFIHGGVGLGKTHLLQAICQRILENDPHKQIYYVSCDAFMNQFIESVQAGRMSEFRDRYRHVDVLVIDDIHFLANRDRSQEEFFHTFNALYQSNRQIVLSSDSPPSEIPQLEERLISRFQWGLVANVTRPGYETRVAIINAKGKLRGIAIPEDVVQILASKIDSNARELEGAIITLQGHAALQDRPIDMVLAREVLGEFPEDGRDKQITLQNIIDAVTSYYNVKLSDLQSKRRHKSITQPRQVCMWLARKHTRFSLEEIGGYFGGRDHTTVMHSIKTVDDRNATDANFTHETDRIEQLILGRA
jgi:chromosomal replication initiator protein